MPVAVLGMSASGGVVARRLEAVTEIRVTLLLEHLPLPEYLRKVTCGKESHLGGVCRSRLLEVLGGVMLGVLPSGSSGCCRASGVPKEGLPGALSFARRNCAANARVATPNRTKSGQRGAMLSAAASAEGSTVASSKVLWSDAAVTTAKNDGRQFLAKLQDAGALGLEHGSVKLQGFRERPAAAVPESSQKLIHFVRHGQGYHNLLADFYNELGLTYNTTGGSPR